MTRQELTASFQESMQHPEFDPDFKHLMDFSGATDIEGNYRDVSSLKDVFGLFSSRGKRAMVTLPGSALHSVARTFEATADIKIKKRQNRIGVSFADSNYLLG